MKMMRGPGLFRGVMAVGVTTVGVMTGLVGAYRSGQENPTPKSAARTMLARKNGWRPQEYSTGLRLDQGPPHFYLSLFPDARDTGTNATITMEIDEQTFVLFTCPWFQQLLVESQKQNRHNIVSKTFEA